MFLSRIDLDDAINRWRDIIFTSLPRDRLFGYVALRKHDLTIELHNMEEDGDLVVFVTDSETLVERFRLAYPFILTYDGVPGYPLEYLVWLSFQMQANFERLGVLEMSAFHTDEDDVSESMEALALGFSRQADLDDFMDRFDGKDLSADPLVGYESYWAEVKAQVGQ